MKKYLLGIFVITIVSACDITVIEEHPYDERDVFTGRYAIEEYSETLDVITHFNIRIDKNIDPYGREVYISNFYGADIEVYAEVNGPKITIPRQAVDYYIIEGFGRIDYDELTMTYTVEDTHPRNRLYDVCHTIAYRR